MTAEEIRALQYNEQDKVTFTVLREIAAQLAEQTEMQREARQEQKELTAAVQRQMASAPGAIIPAKSPHKRDKVHA